MNDYQVTKPFDYVYVENHSTDEIGIKITSGEFIDFIFSMGKIKFDENEEATNCNMNFEYELIRGDLQEDRKEIFEKSVGDMIVYILVESIRNNSLKDLLNETMENPNAAS